MNSISINKQYWLDIISAEYNQFEQLCFSELEKKPKNIFTQHSTVDVSQFNINWQDMIAEEENFYRDPVTNNNLRDEYNLPESNSCLLSMYQVDIDSDLSKQINQLFGFEYSGIQINTQQPGNLVPCHCDRNRSMFYKKLPIDYAKQVTVDRVKKFIIFCDDQKMGQLFCIGNQSLQWQKGTVIEMPWYAPHYTANCSREARQLIFVCGIIPK